MGNFENCGIAYPLTAYDAEEAAELLPKFYQLSDRMSHWSASPQIPKSHLVSTWVAQLIRNQRLLDAVEELIGPNILCWNATFFPKAAGSEGYVGWHQDITYWGLDPSEGHVVTAWLALSDAREDNGCMFFLPGSHKEGMRCHRQDLHQTDNMLLGSQEVALSDREQQLAIPVVLEPGQFSVHHSKLLHGSYGNLSDRPRIGLSINFMSTDVRQTTNGGYDSASLVRGVDEFGHFQLEPAPDSDFDRASIEAYKKALLTPGGIGGADDEIYHSSTDLSHIV